MPTCSTCGTRYRDARSTRHRLAYFDEDFDHLGGDLDAMLDKGIALVRVFGPRVPRLPPKPPFISVGEITSSARRDVGALELITRLRARQQRGEPAQPGGLAWYTPTGLVRYAVVAADQSRILWDGNLGHIDGLAQMTTIEREHAISRLITEVTGQEFQMLPQYHDGPDLVPAADRYDYDMFVEEAFEEFLRSDHMRKSCGGYREIVHAM